MNIQRRSVNVCLFSYSHVHLYYFASIINSKKFKNDDYEITIFSTENIFQSNLETSKQLEKFFSKKGINTKFKFKIFYSPGTGNSIINKLVAYLKNFFILKKEIFNFGFIPNSANPYISLCLLRIKIKKKYNLDEGYAVHSIARYIELNHASRFYKILKFIPNCDISPCQINFNYKTPAYVLNKNNLEKIIKYNKLSKSFIELKILTDKFFKDFSKYLNNINNSYLPIYNPAEEYIFIITSPLTTNGYSEYKNQEVDIITEFIKTYRRISDKKINFFLKLHYRENENKYKKLITSEKLKVITNKIAFQSIAFIYPNYKVVCFHTSAVFSLSFIKNIEKIYCLCPLVKTKSMDIILKSLISSNHKPIKYLYQINKNSLK